MKNAGTSLTTREAILDATDRLLAQNGYKKMTFDDLAQAVGIGKGGVYLHFASNQEIPLPHIDRIIDRLKQIIRAIAQVDESIEQKTARLIRGMSSEAMR
ncbi:MAG: helix-turn-helix domain-containing protein [Pyrinomonadaceae bacterium]